MHHYRCQNVYISATASDRIVDTLEFFPHNYQMLQLSSTDRLIMATKDMTDALQNPHPAVPFAHVGDDTITALAELASIFKLKLRQTSPPTLPAAPPRVKQRTCLAELSNPVLASHAPAASNEITDNHSNTRHHQRSITSKGVHTKDAQPITSEGAHSLAESHSLQYVTEFCGMDTAHMAISLGTNHWSQQHQANAAIHPVTGKEMEYMALMKDPHLQPLWTRGFGKK
jgi:hypothetical protein